MNYNFMSNMKCNIVDVIRTLKDNSEAWNASKDEDGSFITIGDCLEDLDNSIDELYKHFDCHESS